MPSIPQNVSATVQASRAEFLTKKKQKRFRYRDYLPGIVSAPSLEPKSVALIKVEQPEYWPTKTWRDGFQRRKDTATSAFFGAPHGFPATFHDYPPNQSGLPQDGALSAVPSFHEDRSFAAQRLCGANPLSIRRVVDLNDHINTLAINDSHILGGLKLGQLVVEKRLYIVDYSHLATWAKDSGTASGDLIAWGDKWLTAPIALFYWKGPFNDDGVLLPLGIQLSPVPSANVYTPVGSQQTTHPNNWLMAKGAFQVADAQVHEWHSHLVRTHLTLAPFAISSERRLHEEHPVYVLLRPHLRYLLAINDLTGELTGAGGTGVAILAPAHADLLELLESDYRRHDFSKSGSLERDLVERNMHDAPIPYPYRDDGRRVDLETKEYVTEYLKIYYTGDGEVAGDPELQGFVKELRDSGGGKMGSRLTPNGGAVDTMDALVDLLCSIIWTSGPMHSAVNYAQWGYMADVRNQPVAGYKDVDVGPTTELGFDPVDFLPRLDQAKKQSGLMYVLGTYRLDMLGYYPPKFLTDPKAIQVNADYQCALARVGADIREVEELRTASNPHMSYPYLIPYNITNSTSI